jgi:hypothetical protein
MEGEVGPTSGPTWRLSHFERAVPRLLVVIPAAHVCLHHAPLATLAPLAALAAAVAVAMPLA